MPECQKVTHGNPDEFCRNRNLIHQTRFKKRLLNLLDLYSFLSPRITNTNAKLEQEATQNILTPFATMRENSNCSRTVDAGARELPDFNFIPLGRLHSLPACCHNGGVKCSAIMLRQPIAHRDHAAQHGWCNLAFARSVLECTC